MVVFGVHKTGPEWDKVLGLYWDKEDAENQAAIVKGLLDEKNVIDRLSDIRIVEYEVKGCLPKNHQLKK